MSTTTRTAIVHDATAGTTARRVVVIASLAALAADLTFMAIIGAVIPPLAIFAVAVVVAVGATRRWPRAGAIALGLIALLANAGGLSFLLADLSSPSDSIAFLWAVVSGGGRVVVIVAAVLALRDRDGGARRLATAAVALLGIAVIGSVGARLSVSSDARLASDVEVVATGITFPERVSVPAGGAVLVDNRDPVRHTFAIEGTALDVLVEPRVQRRIEIDVPTGTYTFVCTVPGHESMTGTLEVQG